jgi:hypothetical protein
MFAPIRRRYEVLALALMAGMAGESLLLLRVQADRLESHLSEDFKVVMFLKNEPAEGQVKVMEDKLLGLPGVQDVRFVSAAAALAALRREDPELVDSLTWVGENPLRPAFEVRPDPDGLARFSQWLSAAREAANWADVRYRPAEARAILQARLYGHFLSLILSALLCVIAAALASRLWSAPAMPRLQTVVPAVVGAAVGMGAALLAALPARQYLPWWQPPSISGQILVWAAAALTAGVFLPSLKPPSWTAPVSPS